MLSLHVTCRITNSFNTNNPATDMKPLFLDDYEAAPGRLGAWRLYYMYVCAEIRGQALFSTTPVFIGEYHAPHVPVGQDRPGNI